MNEKRFCPPPPLKFHGLKCRNVFFLETWNGKKNFEIRKNDREFALHDWVVLYEIFWGFDSFGYGSWKHSGRWIHGEISYITGFHQKPGWVVFGFREFCRGINPEQSSRKEKSDRYQKERTERKKLADDLVLYIR